MICTECNQEFSKSDKLNVNYIGSGSDYQHKVCPGKTLCTVCQEPINDYEEAKPTAANIGTGWQHKSCTLRIKKQSRQETKCNPSSWVRR